MTVSFLFHWRQASLLVATWLALSGCGSTSNGAAPSSAGAGVAGEAGAAAGGAGAAGAPEGGSHESSGGAVDGGAGQSGGQGGANAAGEGGAGGTPGTSPEMAAVQAILDERCVNCHDRTLSGLPTYPELSLTAGDSYAALVDHRALQPCGGTRVVPGHPEQSYLVAKLTQDTPCDGARMPTPFEPFLPFIPLTDEQMATITAWINAGAPP
ncbi:MAG TPA: hypothetical protein VHB79_06415 [Polyangiaceae bacterium]|nr:hypothetical protein [Polyangiaceae bacterium]